MSFTPKIGTFRSKNIKSFVSVLTLFVKGNLYNEDIVSIFVGKSVKTLFVDMSTEYNLVKDVSKIKSKTVKNFII